MGGGEIDGGGLVGGEEPNDFESFADGDFLGFFFLIAFGGDGEENRSRIRRRI
uniref:Uncharacterized protein n=1 Tax=Brassica campestris TaxID=3711 RepID=M4EY27_BRACM